MSTLLFVVSAPRSGSTFLVAALASHPRIGMTNESGWVAFLRKTSLLASTPSLETIDDGEGFVTQGILPHKYLADFRATFDGFADDFATDFYRRVTGEHTLYGDKILSHNDLAFATRQFGDAKFVELVRDPFDVVVSSFEFQKKQPTAWERTSFEDRCRHLDRFYRSTTELLEGRNRFLVRYEDLIKRTSETLAGLFGFLGLDLDAGVEQFLAGPAQELFSSHGTSSSPQDSIGRWRQAMTEAERELAESMLGAHQRRFAARQP